MIHGAALMHLRLSFLRIPLRLILAAALCLLFCPLPTPAQAAGTSIQVTTTDDELNNDGDCSLREAVRAANLDAAVDGCSAGSGMDTIVLGTGTYLLTIAGTGEDQALTGDLDLSDSVTIIGASAGTTIIDGNAQDRIFHIVAEITVQFSNLTLRNGYAPVGGLYGGGGILNGSEGALPGDILITNCVFSNNHATNDAGGLQNDGDATLSNITFQGNTATGRGGGIGNRGTIVLENMTFYQNTAGESGGGIYTHTSASLKNITFSDNDSPDGGGIFNDGILTLLNSTFSGNNTAISNFGQLQVKNTIFANSTAGDNCLGKGSGVFSSLGHNLDSGDSCLLDNYGDLVNTPPDLGPLADNEGPTLTHNLQEGSPAIDAGDNLDCPSQDQRGAYRPADGDGNGTRTCDMGAVEYNGIFPLYTVLPLVAKH
jgi:CSLREA domain-containing protein